MQLVDQNGVMTSEWSNFMTQLVTELQLNLNNEGYKLPSQSTVNINDLTDADKSTGAMIYDADTNEFKVNIAGTWKVVTVT
jgi:hypothetical protein